MSRRLASAVPATGVARRPAETPARPAATHLARLAALVVAGLLALHADPARAHEGHDHDDAPAARGTGAPQRSPDGAVLLPKASQRLFGVRTTLAARGAQSRAVVLPGRVAVDPDAGGRVQSTIAGRIEPGPRGLPSPGQRVERGQPLAVVRAAIDPLARASQAAQLAEIEAARALAARRVARLRELSDTVPRREIESAESELESLTSRQRALSGGVAAAETLVAPISGTVARADVVAGQVVEPREVLFEVVDPRRLRIEADAADLSLASQASGASVAVDGRAVPLAFVGASRVLREQSLPLVFRGRDGALAGLAVGQPLPVTVRLRGDVEGVALPSAAIVRDASNQTMVWIKAAPERFEPRRVRVEPLDAARVRVVDGLAGGERVVVDGALLIGQVR